MNDTCWTWNLVEAYVDATVRYENFKDVASREEMLQAEAAARHAVESAGRAYDGLRSAIEAVQGRGRP